MNFKITPFIFIVILLGCTINIFSQGSTDCNSAVVALTGSNVASQGQTQYYQFLPLQDEVVTISSCSDPNTYSVSVFMGSCSGDEVETYESPCISGSNSQFSFNVSGGVTYIIALNAAGSGPQTFTWDLATNSIATGGNCANAIPAVVGTGANTFTSNTSNSAMPVWYSFTASGTESRVDISTPGYGYAAYVKVYGSCNILDTIECERTYVIGENGDIKDLIYFYTQPGQTYYFSWDNPNGGQSFTFPFTLLQYTSIAGQVCDQATMLSEGTNSDTVSARYPTWYKYLNNTNIMEVKVWHPDLSEVYCQGRKSCGVNDFERSIKHFENGSPYGIQFEAQVGITYYVKVYPNPEAVTSVIVPPALGQACSNPITAIAGSNSANHTQSTDQWYTYTPTQPGTVKLSSSTYPYFLDSIQLRFYLVCGENATSIGQDSIQIDNGQQLLICLRANAFHSPIYNWNLTFTPTTPGNNFNTAITAVPGTNNAGGAENLWYKYTPAVNSNVTISSCGSVSTYTYLSVWDQNDIYLGASMNSGSCGSHQSNYTLLVEAGTTVYMDWSSTNETGVYDWTLTSVPTGTGIPQGYSCDNPIVISSLGAQSTGFQDNQTWIWYTYTNSSPDTGILTASDCLNTPGFATKVYINNSCGFTPGSEIAEGTTCAANAQSASVTILPGQTVYIGWSQLDGTANTFDWNLSFTSNSAIPQGYTCSNPNIAVLGGNTAKTSVGDEIFTYTPSKAGHLQISTGALPASIQVSVYLNCGDYNTIDPLTGLNNPLQSELINPNDSLGFTVGANTNYLIVWSQGYTSETFNWNLAFSQVGTGTVITAFSIPNQVSSNINSTVDTISVVMPYNTDLTALIPNFSLSNGATAQVGSDVQVSGTSAVDFTNRVTYLVTAQDQVTTKNWKVRVTNALNHAAEITAFSIPAEVKSSTITADSVKVQLPYGADLSDLIASFTLSPGATAKIGSVTQVSGTTANDFTSTVTYVITAMDLTTTKDWKVTVTAPNTAAEIIDFSIPAEVGSSTITTGTTGTVTVQLPYGTDLADLIASFTLSAGATAKVGSVTQVSGTTANDFTSTVTYVITAQDLTTTKDWKVTVTAPNTAAEITSFSIPAEIGSSTITTGTTGTVTVQLPYGTDLADLIASFTLSAGATAKVGSVTQVSGTTANDFTSTVTYVITAQDLTTTKDWKVTLSAPNTAAEITAFSFPTEVGSSTITTGTSGTVTVQLPYGTSLTDLIASFTLSAGATAKIGSVTQVSGTTANDFTSTVTYLITAMDLTTTKDWKVTVTAPNTAAEIATFSIPAEVGSSTITADSVKVQLPYGSSLTDLVASFTLSAGATAKVGSVTQVSGTSANDFTSTVTYVITAQDLTTTKDWTVMVAAPNTAAEITAFSIPAEVGSSTITTGTTGTVKVQLPYGTDLTDLVASFTLSVGATAKIGSVEQVSGTTANNFTSAVTYVITAQDLTTTKDWTVTVTAPDTAAEITAFSFPTEVGSSTITTGDTGKVTAELPFGTNLTDLVATFTLSPGATAKIGSVTQVSGTTANNFTSTVTYVITAQDLSASKIWKVTVSVGLNTAAEIINFSVPGQVGIASINSSSGTVDVMVPYGSELTSIKPAFTLSTGAGAVVGTTPQNSGVTTNDFAKPVKYVVTAQDGKTTKDWTVTVGYAANTATNFTYFSLPNEVDNITFDSASTPKTITLYVKVGTILTDLVANFTLNFGATAEVGTTPQVTGVTPNNFTNPVNYLVTAQDNKTNAIWTVTVKTNVSVLTATGEDINVYPVPANDFVNISIPEGSEGDWIINISNMKGQLVYSYTLALNQGVTRIDLSNCSTGIYNMVLIKGDQSIVKKLIILK